MGYISNFTHCLFLSSDYEEYVVVSFANDDFSSFRDKTNNLLISFQSQLIIKLRPNTLYEASSSQDDPENEDDVASGCFLQIYTIFPEEFILDSKGNIINISLNHKYDSDEFNENFSWLFLDLNSTVYINSY